jgi:molecular chaperone HscB
MHNYFELLGLPTQFALDEAALHRAYIQKQQVVHPDRKDSTNIALSMDVNQAYQTLKSPLLRAQHLLALHGLKVNSEKDSFAPDNTLLMEIMELREAQQEAVDADSINALSRQVKGQFQSALAGMQKAFAENKLDDAAKQAIRLRYLEKILEELNTQKRALTP